MFLVIASSASVESCNFSSISKVAKNQYSVDMPNDDCMQRYRRPRCWIWNAIEYSLYFRAAISRH